MGYITRRKFNSLVSAAAVSPLPIFSIIKSSKANMPKKKGPRVVIVGGGWSGLSIAKQLMQENTNLNVTLIERRNVFFSLPLSNYWIGGLLSSSKLKYRFEDAAKIGNYGYYNAEATGLDRSKQRLQTNRGWIDYDILVLAPGIEYDYRSIGVTDLNAVKHLKKYYPAGFVSLKEQQVIVKQLKSFEKGSFVLTAPQGIYRCAASPYERTCLIASFFQRNKIKGKVILIDSRAKPAVNSEGFLSAFRELYGGTVEYMNSTLIEGVDPFNKIIKTDFDELKFEGGAIYPRTRAAHIIENFGLHDPKNKQFEANIDPFYYNVLGDKRIYVTGDCRPMPFSKSASVAISEGRYVAKVITAELKGKSLKWVTPESICYSMVGSHPKEAILSRSLYEYDRDTQQWGFSEESKTYNKRSQEHGKQAYAWGASHLNKIFGSDKF